MPHAVRAVDIMTLLSHLHAEHQLPGWLLLQHWYIISPLQHLQHCWHNNAERSSAFMCSCQLLDALDDAHPAVDGISFTWHCSVRAAMPAQHTAGTHMLLFGSLVCFKLLCVDETPPVQLQLFVCPTHWAWHDSNKLAAAGVATRCMNRDHVHLQM